MKIIGKCPACKTIKLFLVPAKSRTQTGVKVKGKRSLCRGCRLRIKHLLHG